VFLPWLPCHSYPVVIEQHPTGFSFYFFPGFLAIFILLSSNNNNTLPDFPSTSSLASLPFIPCCHRTTTLVSNTNSLTGKTYIDPAYRFPSDWRLSTSFEGPPYTPRYRSAAMFKRFQEDPQFCPP